MNFLKFIVKNPFRRKNSAILSIVGISIGIIVIVALGGITEGLSDSYENILHAGQADFSISSKETGDSAFGTDTMDASWVDKIKSVPGVDEAYPVYVDLAPVGKDAMKTLIGVDPESIKLADISIKEGRIFKKDSNEAVLGDIYAKDKNYKIGDNVKIDGENFEIVGIIETGDQSMASAVFTSLSKVQDLNDVEDSISNTYVKVKKGENVQKVADRIDKKYGDDIQTITSVTQLKEMSDSINMIRSASWAISLLAIIIGGLGIINTMLMSVFERTREIGVLKAVGWSNMKILIMIVGESLVVTIVSAIIGSIIGYSACVILAPKMHLAPLFTTGIFVRAFIIAIIVGIIGGVYPAIRAVKLPPTEALKYE